MRNPAPEMRAADSPMMDASNVALIILAAGYGRRFGSEDKLAQMLQGRPVSHHALANFAHLGWGRRILVCRARSSWASAFQAAGYCIRYNNDPDSGMLGSLHVGASSAVGLSHALVSLADMPFLRPEHISEVIDLSVREPDQIIATRADGYLGPPAIFPLRRLLQLPRKGEGGARSLLGEAIAVDAIPLSLSDVDTCEDLERLRQRLTDAL